MNYIEAEETQERRNREAQAAWKHYQDTGSYYDGDDTIAWLRSLSLRWAQVASRRARMALKPSRSRCRARWRGASTWVRR